jgi:hypothetical protein
LETPSKIIKTDIEGEEGKGRRGRRRGVLVMSVASSKA